MQARGGRNHTAIICNLAHGAISMGLDVQCGTNSWKRSHELVYDKSVDIMGAILCTIRLSDWFHVNVVSRLSRGAGVTEDSRRIRLFPPRP